MTIEKASILFGISDLYSITNDELKKIFRKLMKSNHPDLGGDVDTAQKLNKAYDILKKQLREIEIDRVIELSQSSLGKVVLSAEEVQTIRCGKKVSTITTLKEQVVLDKYSINRYDVIVEFVFTIKLNGDTLEYVEYRLRSTNDEYNLFAEYYIDENKLGERLQIEVDIYSKKFNITMSSQKLKISTLVCDPIKINLNIERRVKSNGK